MPQRNLAFYGVVDGKPQEGSFSGLGDVPKPRRRVVFVLGQYGGQMLFFQAE